MECNLKSIIPHKLSNASHQRTSSWLTDVTYNVTQNFTTYTSNFTANEFHSNQHISADAQRPRNANCSTARRSVSQKETL